MSLAVAGSGAFGTAMAIALSANGPVTLWARNADTAREMRESRENGARLPGVTLPDAVTVTADPEALAEADVVLVATPAQAMRGFLESHADRLAGKALVACAKGIDLTTGEGPTATIDATVPSARAAVLTGPSFAADIAKGLPTALTLACGDDAAELQDRLSTPAIRLYRTSDTTGAELGGALKNVMAIACGTCMGAGFGLSARAALMTRGFAEMQRLATTMGARPETLAGLAGFGDLTLTCTSEGSRNYRHGLALGRGEPPDETATVEGVATAQAAVALAERLGLDLPITSVVEALTARRIGPEEALTRLLSRPLKEE